VGWARASSTRGSTGLGPGPISTRRGSSATRTGQAYQVARASRLETRGQSSTVPLLRYTERVAVEFVLNGRAVRVEGGDPHCSLLTWLRDSGYTGTKEGCAEGECGACAVAVVERGADGRARFEAVNSCLVPLGQAHGREWVTVEGVAEASDLHPMQRALVVRGGAR